jgi:hypothetical protein
MCVENGSYLWNFEGCKECGKKEPIVITNRTHQEDENEEELVTYKRKYWEEEKEKGNRRLRELHLLM